MLYFLSATVHVLLGALELCMFARAILSWFPPEEESLSSLELCHAVRQADPGSFFIIQEGVLVSDNFERRLS